MVGVRQRSSGSWLDPEASGILGWKLGKRLWGRVQGQQGLFLTLTYRHAEYGDCRELYDFQSERQDVPLFLRRLSRAIGVNFKGKWLCKLEFQEGGWVHFHIVLLGVEFIDHALLTRCWGWGHVWVSRLNKKNCFYLTKYVAKGGRVPWWLYNERSRSVKIIRVSPGFWLDAKPRKPQVADADYERYGPAPPAVYTCAYVPIGQKIQQGRGVIVRSEGRYRVFFVDPAEFLGRLARWHRGLGRESGWNLFAGTMHSAEAAAAACEHRTGPEGSKRSTSPPRSGGLHLRGNSNPDAAEWPALPWWVEQGLREDCPSDEECWATAV